MSFEATFAHRDALIAAAIDEFDHHGYHEASVNRILTRSGMSKGQFYHHFESKEALYLGLVEHMIARKRALMATLPPPTERPADFFGVLRMMLHQGAALARKAPDIDRFARSFLRERGRPIHAVVLQRFSVMRDDALAQAIDAAIARGDFAEDLPPAFIHRAIGVVLQHSAELLDTDDVASFDRSIDALLRFLESGLRASASS